MTNALRAMRTLGSTLLGILCLVTTLGSTAARAETCGLTTWPLVADDSYPVGTVSVSNDTQNLYLTYTVNYPGASFSTLNAWVGSDIGGVPYSTSLGLPKPSTFPYISGTGAFPDAFGGTTYTFTIPFTDLLITDLTGVCGLPLYVVAYADIKLDLNGDGMPDRIASGWGGSVSVKDPRFWMYGAYTVCCDFGPPPVEKCDTAFGKGDHVFAYDAKANPEKLPSLALTRNRWGWAGLLGGPGSYVQDLWAGAGLNDTTRGTKVGTVTIDWSGSLATVTYRLTAAGYSMREAHLYAEDGRPSTVAPGSFGHTAFLDAGAREATFTVPLADLDGIPGVWAIAHAVVCR